MRSFVWLVFAGCGRVAGDCPDGFTVGDDGLCYEDEVATGPTCAEGFVLAEDGMCYPANIPEDGVDLARADWPECVLGDGDRRLNLQRGCADDLCVGMTYAEMVAAAGEPIRCKGDFVIECEWENGAGAELYDFDGDREPDDDPVYSILLFPAFDGHTREGFGVGQSMGCWLDQFGTAESIEFIAVGDGYELYELVFFEPNYVFVRDEDFDGVVDEVQFFGF